MKKVFYIIITSIILAGCSGDADIKVEKAEAANNPIDTPEERVAQIDKYTALLYKDSLNFNAEYATQLLAAYDDYIKFHSFEAISKDYEFKAGELAKALNKPNLAIKYFNNLIARDPKNENAPVALFYKAMIIGDMLHEDELAIKTYQEFIDKYPEHPFVESAKASIKMQGKSLDEIVAGFEDKNDETANK